jgi:hypothetical protein
MPHLIGAGDLGLDVQWEFGFVENGTRAATTPGVVYLDVGGNASLGILDHHSSVGDGSTAHVLIDRPDLAYNHLMGPWLAERERGQSVAGARWTPRIVTHYYPDWDSIVAAHLLMRLVMDGEFPPYAHALAAYASLVDHGRSHVDRSFPESLLTPHFAHAVAGLVSPAGHAQLMNSGLALLERVLDDIHATFGSRPPWDRAIFEVRRDNLAPTLWRTDQRFAPLADFLLAEPARFAEDRKHGEVIVAPLPAADSVSAIPVPIFVSRAELKSPLAVYFLREEGIPALVRPLSTAIRDSAGAPTTHFPRVIITVDPNIDSASGRRLNLRGLGYTLERAERRWRSLGGRTDPRGGPPRWDDGSCEVADPWYDGRGHDFTIIDSPRAGTELPFDEIVRIVTQTAFWERPIRAGRVTDLFLVAESSREPRRGLAPFEAIADPLRVLYADSDAAPIPTEMTLAGDATVRTSYTRRRYPVGTSVEYDILESHAEQETTLEAVTRAVLLRRSLTHPDAGPHHTLIWLDVLPCGPHARPVNELIRSLHSGELSHQLLHGVATWQSATCVAMIFPTAERTTETAVREVFCYGAFVADTLSMMSRRVTQILPGDDREIDALGLRMLQHDALRFQSRYYQLDLTRDPIAMALAVVQRAQMGIDAHLAENLAELEQLGTIAQIAAAEREARADRSVQWALTFVALLAIVQTAAAMLSLEPGQASHPVMLGSYFIAIVLFLSVVVRGRRPS